MTEAGNNISSEDKKPDLHDLGEVGHTESGKNLDPLRALKTFLVHNREDIQHDKDHTIEEALSDVLAVGGAGYGAFEAAVEQNVDPLLDQTANIISTVAAYFLVTGLIKQRRQKERDQKEALETWLQYERDKKDPAHGEELEQRIKVARENVQKRMAAQGIMYEGLPDKTDRFDSRLHKEDARKYGLDIGEARGPFNPIENIGRRVSDVRGFLRKPHPEKIVVAAEGWQGFVDKTKDVVFFVPDAVTRGFKNAFDVVARPGPLLEIGGEAKRSFSYESRRGKRSDKLVSKVEQSEKLTMEDLRGVTLENLRFVAKGLSDEEVENIRDGLASLAEVKKRRKRALVNFSLQSVFQLAQVVELGLKLSHHDSSAWRHGYTLAMASGPWRGFAKEWLDANKKINSERSQLIEYSSKVFGVRVDEREDKDVKNEAEEKDAAHQEPQGPANDL